jgi:hypothetical protein
VWRATKWPSARNKPGARAIPQVAGGGSEHLIRPLAPKCRGPYRIHSLREILNAVFYVLRSGYPWRLVRREYPPYRPRKTTKPAEVRFRALLTEGGAELLELSRV